VLIKSLIYAKKENVLGGAYYKRSIKVDQICKRIIEDVILILMIFSPEKWTFKLFKNFGSSVLVKAGKITLN